MSTEWLWAVVIACGLATFVWRALGVIVVRRIDPRGPFFQWITCVSYAMVAGLVFRMLMLPESELASVSLSVRIISVAIAFAAYYLFGRRLIAGVLTGALGLSLIVVWVA